MSVTHIALELFCNDHFCKYLGITDETVWQPIDTTVVVKNNPNEVGVLGKNTSSIRLDLTGCQLSFVPMDNSHYKGFLRADLDLCHILSLPRTSEPHPYQIKAVLESFGRHSFRSIGIVLHEWGIREHVKSQLVLFDFKLPEFSGVCKMMALANAFRMSKKGFLLGGLPKENRINPVRVKDVTKRLKQLDFDFQGRKFAYLVSVHCINDDDGYPRRSIKEWINTYFTTGEFEIRFTESFTKAVNAEWKNTQRALDRSRICETTKNRLMYFMLEVRDQGAEDLKEKWMLIDEYMKKSQIAYTEYLKINQPLTLDLHREPSGNPKTES